MMRRRMGAPLLRTAAVGGVAYMAGSSAARKTAAQQQQDAAQNAQLADLQQQQAALAQQQYQAQPMYAQQQPMYAQQPPTPQMTAQSTGDVGSQRDPLEALKQLGELKTAGVISDEEFQAKKAELLRQI